MSGPSAQRERDQQHYEVFRKHNKDRTDVSFFLCHFTKSKPPVKDDTPIRGFAHQRFEAILTRKEVSDCALPHLGPHRVHAVCFTEMMLPSLSMHAENYSPWGIAFHKSFLFNKREANQVLYCRSDLFETLKKSADGNHDLLRYIALFVPMYCDQRSQGPIDYSHEREWRTPGPVKFELENLAYVFVPDMSVFQELMPDLHAELCNKCVEIRVIEKVVRTDSCQNGYRCNFGLGCKYGHTQDEKDVFLFRKRSVPPSPGDNSQSGQFPETVPGRDDEDDVFSFREQRSVRPIPADDWRQPASQTARRHADEDNDWRR